MVKELLRFQRSGESAEGTVVNQPLRDLDRRVVKDVERDGGTERAGCGIEQGAGQTENADACQAIAIVKVQDGELKKCDPLTQEAHDKSKTDRTAARKKKKEKTA